MVRAAFEFLLTQPDGAPARDVIAAAERKLTPTEFEQG